MARTARSRRKLTVPARAALALSTAAVGALLAVPAAASAATRTSQPAGAAISWGSNSDGQLGIGTTCNRTTGANCLSDSPVTVLGQGTSQTLSPVVAVSGGTAFSLALLASGAVRSWGDGDHGELGNGANGVEQDRPVAVVGPGGTGRLTGVTAVAAGDNHSVALRSDGSVWTWGLNDLGQLGIGNSTGPATCKPFSNFAAAGCSRTPAQVVGPNASAT